MKYEITRNNRKERFEPFTISLTFETKAEYRHFHDKVMPSLNKEVVNHELYGNVYLMGHSEIDHVTGDFDMGVK